MVHISLRMRNGFKRFCGRINGSCARPASAQAKTVASNARVIVQRALSSLPAKRVTATDLCASGKRISEVVKTRLKAAELARDQMVALVRSFCSERVEKRDLGHVMARQNLARDSIDRYAGPAPRCPVF